MLYVVAFLIAAGVGFAGSRLLRQPSHAAQAASVVRNVGGSVGARRGLDAPELQRACFSEMVRHARVDRRGRTSVPSRYVIDLNPGDLAVVDGSRRWFIDGLAQALRDAAAQNGWTLVGEVEIELRADPRRRPGAPLAEPRGADGEVPHGAVAPGGALGGERSPSRAPKPSSELALVRADTGERVPLDGSTVTIGRSPENTISAADERISRRHARIERGGGGWVVIDLGSANGTRVGGERVRSDSPVPISAGKVVSVGPLDLKVVAAADRQPSIAGTRALDEADRTRISQEVLGLPGTADRRRGVR